MNRFEGKTVLVTGGSRGQGEAEARIFAREGAHVVIADILDDQGEALAVEIGDAAMYCHLDVSSEEQWLMAVEKTLARFESLDVLINNAGIFTVSELEHTRIEDYMRMIEINQVGVFLGMKSVIAPMRQAGGGSIVNISSVAALQGIANFCSYTASKWAVRGMTKSAAMELGPYGIRVNSIHPGPVDTPMIQGDCPELNDDAMYAKHPIPRMGSAEEIAKLVVFVASQDASFCTGAEFVADGGASAGPGTV